MPSEAGIKKVPRARKPTPFYRKGHFWGPAGAFLALFLSGMGTAMSQHPLLGRWLVGFSWPFAFMSLWVLANTITGKKKRRLALRIALVVLVAFAGILCDWLLYRQDYPKVAFTVTPAKMRFHKYGDQFPFTIKNVTSHDIYNVTAKFSYGTPANQFMVGLSDSTGKPLESGIPGKRMADMQGLGCRSNSGSYSTYVGTIHLNPHEEREIKFTYNGAYPVVMETRAANYTYNDPEKQNDAWIRKPSTVGMDSVSIYESSRGTIPDEDCHIVIAGFLLR